MQERGLERINSFLEFPIMIIKAVSSLLPEQFGKPVRNLSVRTVDPKPLQERFADSAQGVKGGEELVRDWKGVTDDEYVLSVSQFGCSGAPDQLQLFVILCLVPCRRNYHHPFCGALVAVAEKRH